MPNTYEKVVDGVVVERSLAFAGTEHDVQLSHAASTTDSPWHLVDANGERVKPDPMPVFTAPSDEDADDVPAEPGSPTALAEEAERHKHDDEPDESGDHTEE